VDAILRYRAISPYVFLFVFYEICHVMAVSVHHLVPPLSLSSGPFARSNPVGTEQPK